ncbi:Luciferin 4-monooxygenase [Eumeta japonica]|uniref:Luciferin 4-monooxygenase n=1 Tax=Eumeta variegata TaxID=151549 RepID=A0A4C1SF29_EUMVA|nr:Luciferin 4-monooxygenase [Eumeta japonica]
MEQEFKKALSNHNFGSRCHLGPIVLQSLAEHADFTIQIDAATGERQTKGDVLRKSVLLASAMRACGLRPGDVLALSGPNHLDLCIPYYAALYNGLPIFGVDPLFKYEEILSVLSYAKPKIAFCSPDKEKDFEAAAESLHLDIKIITFHRGERTMEGFIKEHSSEDDLINFKAADFEPSQIYAWLLSTSGSMGTPKAVAFTAQVVYEAMIFYKTFYFKENSVHLLMSPVQWLSYSVITIGAALTKATILTSSASRTIDHVVDVINKYKAEPEAYSLRTRHLPERAEQRLLVQLVLDIIQGVARTCHLFEIQIFIGIRSVNFGTIRVGSR